MQEKSLEPTRVRERGLRGPASRKFKSLHQAQRFLGAYAAISNLLELDYHGRKNCSKLLAVTGRYFMLGKRDAIRFGQGTKI